ncbi:MAG: carbohydrate ABC transporter permease [Ruminococcaceae bacterium]|nr:carbohydrate ABC transporter permease [Oscillospiraceae bacterium]
MAIKGNLANPRKFQKDQLKLYAILIPMTLVMVLPIVYIVCHAFKPLEELFAFPPKFFVSNPSFTNFYKLVNATASSTVPFSRYLFNSIFVTACVLGFTLIFTTMAAFALSKMNFKAKKILMAVNDVGLMFVAIALQIPRYLIVDKFGMHDTYFAHILPIVVLPVGLLLLKQFVDGVPSALIEAAHIDGAGELMVYTRIILPLVKPAMATVSILMFQEVWNNIETSSMYIDADVFKTFAFYMQTLSSNTNSVAGQGLAAAATLIMFVPNVVLFVIMQSRVMSTMATSGIK